MTMRLKLFAALFAACSTVMAQVKAPENWFNLDSQADGINGVSSEKVYKDLLKGKKSRTVVVAVLDGGVDAEHEDLKDIMWTNQREIPNNGIDDDKNGYVDDIHGWNFLGGKDGRNVNQESLEITRVYGRMKAKYEKIDVSKLSKADKVEYNRYLAIKKEVETNLQEATENLKQYTETKTISISAFEAADKAFGDKAFTKENIEAISAGTNRDLLVAKNILLRCQSIGLKSLKEANEFWMSDLEEGIAHYTTKVKYQYNPDFNPRLDIIKDDYNNSYDRNYGNNDVKGPDAFHGTHVAGIIGAIRHNNKGIDGVADNVRIMGVRCVPDGDERDKDVANAIIYAVDNGAQVINMSFGKSYSWDKIAVDKAVKYAMSKDVLLVHAAGNDGKSNDTDHNNYPTARFDKAGWFSPKKAKNWIEVGALSWKKGEDAAATFSNYGAETVDVFAPGVDIYSTTPNGEYKNASGTSMASPVTAGVAAIIRSYFPELTAEQVKECIEKSVVSQADMKVIKPGSEDEKVAFSKLCRTAGTVNAFKAVQLASTMKGKKKLLPRA
jgi:subtilisin family serine protease